MIIGLVGDLEGDRDWAVNRLRALGERGDVEVACQLGDLRFAGVRPLLLAHDTLPDAGPVDGRR